MLELMRDMEMTIGEMTKYLSRAYTNLIRNEVPLKKFPSVMLWGAPGVGKSQGVKQIAADIEKNTGKNVTVTDVRLLLFNPVDLRGIPTANADKTLAVWLKPKIFQMDESDDVINILFLDEISAAPQSVQAAAYQITLDRMIGEHKLPENCIVIAAGNRITDKSVAYNMPKALANRLCHIGIRADADSWHDWAVKSGINSVVTGFIQYNQDALISEPQGRDDALPTPRSWEMVSNILNYVSNDMDEVFPLVAGCIGANTASALKTWNEIYGILPLVEDIFSGKEIQFPKRPEMLFALISEIVAYASKHPDEEGINNSIDFAMSLSPEFRARMFSDYIKLVPAKILKKNADYRRWAERNDIWWEDYEDN